MGRHRKKPHRVSRPAAIEAAFVLASVLLALLLLLDSRNKQVCVDDFTQTCVHPHQIE